MTRAIDRQLYDTGLIAGYRSDPRGALAQRFLMPPFSVLSAREGFWQDRKRRWLELGINSEVGRGEKLTYNININPNASDDDPVSAPQTSVFDPVLCELLYRWFAPPGCIVVDPFAGGSVRGCVASVMGYRYWGAELRPEQVAANRKQLGEFNRGTYIPKWNVGDARQIIHTAPACDFVLSCPPYGSLEVYSNDPADISNMDEAEFDAAYSDIIAGAVGRMRDDTFAAWVVGNYRDKSTGRMVDLVGKTVVAFEAAGAAYYNEAILVTAAGSAAVRGVPTFVKGSRKLVKVHQNVLVFIKGNAKSAAAKIPLEE